MRFIENEVRLQVRKRTKQYSISVIVFLSLIICFVLYIQWTYEDDDRFFIEPIAYVSSRGTIFSDNRQIMRTSIDKNKNKRYHIKAYVKGKAYSLAKSILGDKRIGMGGRGIEHSFDNELGGMLNSVEIDRLGNSMRVIIDERLTSQIEEFLPGKDIYTTLNIEMQRYAEKLLLDALPALQADYGLIMVMEVKTGELKVVANMEKQKNSTNQAVVYRDNYNYALASNGVHAPGSTFKAVSMLAVLEEGIDPNDTIHVFQGSYSFASDCIKKDPTTDQFIKISEVLERSSNIGIARLLVNSFSDKPQQLIEYFKKFKIYEEIFFQLEGVGRPIYFTPNEGQWSQCSIPSISMGYEMRISPIQILAFYNAIAGDGKFILPLLVKEIRSGTKTMQKFETQVLSKQIASKKSILTLQNMLLAVVQGNKGTARHIRQRGYQIAGKTGTARRKERINNGYYVSFVGYFPADNPKYTCIVAIDNPKRRDNRIYGSTVAAPLFGRMSNYIYRNYIHKHIP